MPYYLYFINGLSESSRVTFYYMQKLYDTPGVHLHHRQAAVVHSEDLPSLAPQSRLRGQSLPVSSFLFFSVSISVFPSVSLSC